MLALGRCLCAIENHASRLDMEEGIGRRQLASTCDRVTKYEMSREVELWEISYSKFRFAWDLSMPVYRKIE